MRPIHRSIPYSAKESSDLKIARVLELSHVANRCTSPRVLTMGLEREIAGVNSSGDPADISMLIRMRSFIHEESSDYQIELDGPPTLVFHLRDLLLDVTSKEDDAEELANQQGLRLCPIGCTPYPHPHDMMMPGYSLRGNGSIPEFAMELNGGVDSNLCRTVRFHRGSAQLIQATQTNIQVSPEEAVFALNHSFDIEQYRVALSGNARFMAGQNTKYADLRTSSWKMTHDFRHKGCLPTVGLPDRYFSSVTDYLRWCSEGAFFSFRKRKFSAGWKKLAYFTIKNN